MHDTPNGDALPSPILDSYEAYGCKVNAISVDELFARYEQAGFLYPAKMQRLAPFMPLVKDNWRKALRAGELIHYIVSYGQPGCGSWASLTSWRSTRVGWNTQHLVGMDGPVASRAVMLSTQAVRIRDQFDESHQNWFQRTNRFANKVFGSFGNTLGNTVGWVGDYSYFAVPLNVCTQLSESASVRAVRADDMAELRSIADAVRSTVYTTAEGLDDDDCALESVDELYRKVGLRRYRRIHIAEIPGRSGIAGFALAYRGPLGFNFSFLENRCDLVFAPGLSQSEVAVVARSLLNAVVSDYADFPPQAIPVVVSVQHAPCLRMNGVEHIRDYAQSAWLPDGNIAWYRHVESIYDRVIRAERRHGLGMQASSGKAQV